MLLLAFHLQHKFNGALQKNCNLKEGELTVVTPLSVVYRVLLEGELLQIGVGLGQQADEEEARAGAVEGRHCLRGRRYFMAWRIDYYHRQADDVHPHGLRTVNAPFDITSPRGEIGGIGSCERETSVRESVTSRGLSTSPGMSRIRRNGSRCYDGRRISCRGLSWWFCTGDTRRAARPISRRTRSPWPAGYRTSAWGRERYYFLHRCGSATSV